ncbi:MAG TPA: zf-HC2 domain-containing protein [Terriglobales bacterium]|nr:zf-HC2 domain-containing protein [Terriglobales bacterium]
MKHREIIELLPWYVNATLKEDERKTVESHLAGCRECALELESLALMRKAVVELGDEVPTPSPVLLHQALAQIEDYERTRPPSRRSEASGNFWDRLAVWWRPTPVFARALIAVQLVLVLVLGAMVFHQQNRIDSYKTLTAPVSEKGSVRLAVGFREGASEAEITQTLLGIQGKIVDGPSALGLYTIQVPIRPEQTQAIEKLLQTLRENRRVVRFAGQKL